MTRVRQLAASGKRAEGQRLIDSVLAGLDPASNAYGDALYWRAALAATAANAERDYRRVIIEYPFATHSGDALLGLSDLEAARGDKTAAVGHLQRFWRENGASPAHAKTGLQLARMLFDQNEGLRACVVLEDARATVVEKDVELRNQIGFYWDRCAGIRATAAVASRDSAIRVMVAPRSGKTVRPDSARVSVKAAVGKDTARVAKKTMYTVQVAAYPTREEADRLVSRLAKQGRDAFIQGTSKPYRVSVGHHATRAEATQAAAELRKNRIDGFVTNIRE